MENKGYKLTDERIEEYQKAIDEYFKTAQVPNISGLCLHIGISRQYFYDVMHDKGNNLVDTFTRAHMRIEDIIVTNALLGNYNAQISGKLLNSKFDYIEHRSVEADVKQKGSREIKIINDLQ